MNSTEILRTIDKLEKIGLNKVEEELKEQGLEQDKINKIIQFIQISGSNEEKLDSLKKLKIENDIFNEGLEELIAVNHHVKVFGVPEENYMIDLTIARGLDYYTGTVYETFLDEYTNIGSICSGGRYDNLAEYYTKQKLPGVGISIGLTRLFYQLNEANLIKTEDNSLTKVLIIPMKGYLDQGIKIASDLREKDINTQIYLETEKNGQKNLAMQTN